MEQRFHIVKLNPRARFWSTEDRLHQTLSDCRRGECGLCAMDVIAVDGEVDHRDVFLSEHEKKSATRICACVSRAVGTLTLDSAYRAES